MSVSECTNNDDECKHGNQASWVEGAANAVIFVGAIVGQLSMGFLGDLFTRNYALMITLSISAFSAFLSGVIPTGSSSSVYAVIILFRFFLGVGLGGIYPLSATKSSEDASSSHDGKINSEGSSWAFFWQMPALIAPWLFAYLLSLSTTLSVSIFWRLVLGI